MEQPLSCNINEAFQRDLNNKKSHPLQRLIAITGGIASGKSSLEKCIQAKKNYPSIDADILSHEILDKNIAIKTKIINRYGANIIKRVANKNQIVDRKELKKIIFSNQEERNWIEGLMHPVIKETMLKKISQLKSKEVIILIIPLLFEAQFTDLCDEIWLIHCSKKNQLKRLIERDQITKEKAKIIIEAQWPVELKKLFSNVIIDNNGSIKDLNKQIKDLI